MPRNSCGHRQLQTNIAISVQRVLIGFACGAGAGLVLGGLTVRPASSTTWSPPPSARSARCPRWPGCRCSVCGSGIGEPPKITLVAIGAFFPVYTTVASALSHLDPALVEVGRAYGRRGVGLFTSVLLPATAPALLSGLRLGLAQSWLFLVRPS